MVRSSHHLPLPSLPPPRVVLCSPFSPPLSSSPSSTSSRSPSGKVRRSSGAAVSPHRIYRADPNPQRAYQYVNESPTGTTTTTITTVVTSDAPFPPACPIDYIGGRISHMPATFFRPSESSGSSLSLSLFLPTPVRFSHALPPLNRAPSRHSNYEFDIDASHRGVSSAFGDSCVHPRRECTYSSASICAVSVARTLQGCTEKKNLFG